MSSKFSDQSNFLIAFVAAALGMLVFRSELEHFVINIFGSDVSGFYLALGFILMLSLAAYISAFAVVSSNFNITSFPLTKYLEKTATFLNVFALFYPLIISIIMLVSFVIAKVDFTKIDSNFASSFTGLIGVIAGLILSLGVSKAKRLRDVEDKFTKLAVQYKGYKENLKEYAFLEHYEFVAGYAREYLRARGYGVRSGSLGFIYKVLNSKDIVDKSQLEDARWVTGLRNRYAHAQNMPTRRELQRANEVLMKIYDDINKQFTALVMKDESNND